MENEPLEEKRQGDTLLVLPTLRALFAELPQPPEGSAVRVKVS
jgi:hypothetical protein